MWPLVRNQRGLKLQSQTVCNEIGNRPDDSPCPSLHDSLHKLGLKDLDIDSCKVFHYWKSQLLQLMHGYEDVFSKSKLDCGMAKEFVHCIHLSDDWPFRLPYDMSHEDMSHEVSQAQTEMKEHEIIHKSDSKWSSPLVLVWKKSGNLRICVDYRWLNAHTVKDAHPLPHQSDCSTVWALERSAIFSAMDLTSGFYNIIMAKEDKKTHSFHCCVTAPQALCASWWVYLVIKISWRCFAI